MVRDKNIKRDGLLSALGGVDSGRSPALLSPDKIAFAINVTLRGGFPDTRPGFFQHALSFDNAEKSAWFWERRLQGAFVYYSPRGDTLIAVSIAGRIFVINPLDDMAALEITPSGTTTTTANFNAPAVGSDVVIAVTDASRIWAGLPITINGKTYTVVSKSANNVTATNLDDTPAALISSGASVVFLDQNSPTQPTTWFEQAQDWLVIQNDLDRAILFDGGTARRAAVDEVPSGGPMVFNEEIQRLAVSVNGNQIAIGDIAGGPTSVIKFTENTYLNEGFPFQVPRKHGRITGLAMVANIDRSNGQGAMVAFCERGISSFNLPPAREQWKNLDYPVQINMPLKYSATSHYSIVEVNGDLFYRAKDGLRSFAYAVKEIRSWGNKPQSREMNRVVLKDTVPLLHKASCIMFDNRLLFTLSPHNTTNGVSHRAIGALDFNIVGSMADDVPPLYEGIWTGISPTIMVVGDFGGEERAFAFTLNANGHNELWEFSKDRHFDGNDLRIDSVIESRSMPFGNPVEMKRMASYELFVEKVSGTVDMTLLYRPDSYPCWFSWGTKQICAKNKECEEDPDICKAMRTYRPGYRTRLGFGQPPDSCDTSDNKPARLGYDHQIRLEWSGKMAIRKYLAKVEIITEEEYPKCD